MSNKIYYFWYDHLNRCRIPVIIDSIQKSIENKDYNSFMFYYNNQKTLEITLPNYAYLSDDSYIDITIKENFDKIEFSEYECG